MTLDFSITDIYHRFNALYEEVGGAIPPDGALKTELPDYQARLSKIFLKASALVGCLRPITDGSYLSLQCVSITDRVLLIIDVLSASISDYQQNSVLEGPFTVQLDRIDEVRRLYSVKPRSSCSKIGSIVLDRFELASSLCNLGGKTLTKGDVEILKRQIIVLKSWATSHASPDIKAIIESDLISHALCSRINKLVLFFEETVSRVCAMIAPGEPEVLCFTREVNDHVIRLLSGLPIMDQASNEQLDASKFLTPSSLSIYMLPLDDDEERIQFLIDSMTGLCAELDSANPEVNKTDLRNKMLDIERSFLLPFLDGPISKKASVCYAILSAKYRKVFGKTQPYILSLSYDVGFDSDSPSTSSDDD